MYRWTKVLELKLKPIRSPYLKSKFSEVQSNLFPRTANLTNSFGLWSFVMGKLLFLTYIYITVPYFTHPDAAAYFFWAYIILFEHIHGPSSAKCSSFYLALVPKHSKTKNSLSPNSLNLLIWSTVDLHEWFSF